MQEIRPTQHHLTRRIAAIAVAVLAMAATFPSAASAHGTFDGSKQTYADEYCYYQSASGWGITPWVPVGQVMTGAFQNASTVTGLSMTATVAQGWSSNTHGGTLVLIPRQQRWHNGSLFIQEPTGMQLSVNPNSDAAMSIMRAHSNNCY